MNAPAAALPKGVYQHGKNYRARIYLTMPDGSKKPAWLNLGRTPELAVATSGDLENITDGFVKRQALTLRDSLDEMLLRAQKRAKMKGREFALTRQDVREMLIECRGRCSVSGLPLTASAPPETSFSKNPFAPSLDRIDCAKGYTRDNTRIVCTMANTAMSEWGESYLRILAAAVLGKDGQE